MPSDPMKFSAWMPRLIDRDTQPSDHRLVGGSVARTCYPRFMGYPADPRIAQRDHHHRGLTPNCIRFWIALPVEMKAAAGEQSVWIYVACAL